MGARFDRWLAQPSTLHFLRQLIGPQAGLSARTRPCWVGGHIQSKRAYAAAVAHLDLEDINRGHEEVYDEISYTRHAQWLLHRAAQELSLKHTASSPDTSEIASAEGTALLQSYHDQMRVQADVDSKSLVGKLLIDQPDNIGNMEAWYRILEFRQRIDGLRGVLDVWRGMYRRNVKLPHIGDHLDIFWTTFINAAVNEDHGPDRDFLLNQIYRQAQHGRTLNGETIPFLYKTIVGRFLRVFPGPHNAPGSVLEWHQRFSEDGFFQPAMIHQLTLDTVLSIKKTVAFKKFKRIYSEGKCHDCYDHCMPLVLQHATQNEAVQWHHFFVDQKDLPSEKVATEPAVQLFLQLDKQDNAKSSSDSRGREKRQATHALLNRDASAPSFSLPPLTRASMSSLVGDVHGIKPKAISDSFCARMFATSAFSIDFVVRGLSFLGIELLGSASLRELALRSDSLQEFRSHLAEIKKAGIGIADSMYVRILDKVVKTKNIDLYKALLSSDQHPESYNDPVVQESLVEAFLGKQDWQQLHLTLLCLSQADHYRVGRAWNCLLRHYVRVRDYWEVERIMDYLRSEQIPLSGTTVQHLMKEFLPKRNPSKQPQKPPRGQRPLTFLSLDLVANACMYQIQRGIRVPAATWIELLKRYGIKHVFDKAERLCLFLAQTYKKDIDDNNAVSTITRLRQRRHKPYATRKSMLDTIFSDNMLEAMVKWSWRGAAVRNLLHSLSSKERKHMVKTKYWQSMKGSEAEPWARGILLLKQLKAAGVQVRQRHVKKACTQCLWTMFGPGGSKRTFNEKFVKRNRLSPAHYVKHMNKIWDEPVFDVTPEMLKKNLASEAKLFQRIFGDFRLTDKKTRTYADVVGWSTKRAANGGKDGPRTQRSRRYLWAVSPYRGSASTLRQQRSATIKPSIRKV